jgi:hypothetical protein
MCRADNQVPTKHPLISTRLQPGVGGRRMYLAASAAFRARGKAAKAAGRSLGRRVTGLKPGANERKQPEETKMSDEISISKTLKIRDCGLKEDWLQDQIEADPSILGLGDLEVVRREKTQSSGGRLDFLLQDSADGSMYEALVALTAYPLEMDFTKNYVSLGVNGSHYFTFRARSGGKSFLTFWSSDVDVAKISGVLDEANIPYDTKPYSSGGQIVRMYVDQKMIQSKSELFKKLAEVVKQSMERDANPE